MPSLLKHSTFFVHSSIVSGYPSPGIGFHDSDASFSFLLNVKLNDSLSFGLYVARNESRSCRFLARRKTSKFSLLLNRLDVSVFSLYSSTKTEKERKYDQFFDQEPPDIFYP